MKISEYILELLTNEHEANMLENEQNFYGRVNPDAAPKKLLK